MSEAKFNLPIGEFLGEGEEKVVYTHSDDPDKVVGAFRPEIKESSARTKARYYCMKLLHEFFPDHVSDISLVATEPRHLITDRIFGQSVSESDNKEAFEHAKDLTRRAYEVGLMIEKSFQNFILQDLNM